MDKGTMLIPNSLGENWSSRTTLIVLNGKASALPPDNALNDAKNALINEKRNPTVSSGNVSFLTFWIRLYLEQEKKAKETHNA
jgi:hypothetical protein